MAEPENAILSGLTPQLLAGQSKSTSSEFIEFSNDSCRDANGKNCLYLICKFCKCKVMKSGYGTYVSKEKFLPDMTTKYEIGTSPAGVIVMDHWVVEDMFDFENVGFTKPVEDGVKYLICADCERGPIGWHQPADVPNEFFIACNCVNYGTS